MDQELKKYSPDEVIEKIAKLEDWAYDSENEEIFKVFKFKGCLLYTSPSPRD